MSARVSFDDVLDRAISALADGETMPSILARYPDLAPALRPLLESASAAMAQAASGAPEPRHLDWNASPLRVALAEQRGAPRGQRQRLTWGPAGAFVAGFKRLFARRVPLVPRRVAIASLSIPGIVVAAIAVVGTGSVAAAALVATQPELRHRVADLAANNLHLSTDSGDTGATETHETPVSTASPSSGGAVSTAVPSATVTAGGGTPTGTPADSASPTPVPSSSDPASGTEPSPDDLAPGQSGDAPGNSGDAPGHSGDAPGQSGTPHGQAADKTKTNDPAPGNASRTPPPTSNGNGPPATPGANGKGHANQ